MRDVLIEALLTLCLACPGEAAALPAELLRGAAALPQAAKERIVRFASGRGHFDTESEAVDWDAFDGAYHVLYRRMAGRPLPRHMGDPRGPVVR